MVMNRKINNVSALIKIEEEEEKGTLKRRGNANSEVKKLAQSS